jgi:hypothetical protein
MAARRIEKVPFEVIAAWAEIIPVKRLQSAGLCRTCCVALPRRGYSGAMAQGRGGSGSGGDVARRRDLWLLHLATIYRSVFPSAHVSSALSAALRLPRWVSDCGIYARKILKAKTVGVVSTVNDSNISANDTPAGAPSHGGFRELGQVLTKLVPHAPEEGDTLYALAAIRLRGRRVKPTSMDGQSPRALLTTAPAHLSRCW